jgi:hypothetical protein
MHVKDVMLDGSPLVARRMSRYYDLDIPERWTCVAFGNGNPPDMVILVQLSNANEEASFLSFMLRYGRHLSMAGTDV